MAKSYDYFMINRFMISLNKKSLKNHEEMKFV